MKVAICATTAISVNSQRPLIYTECSSWACSSVRPVKDRSDLSAMNFPPERYADAANPAAGCLRGLHGPSGFCPPFRTGSLDLGSPSTWTCSGREYEWRRAIRFGPCAGQRAAQVQRAVRTDIAQVTDRCERQRHDEDRREIDLEFQTAATAVMVALRRVGCHVGHYVSPPCELAVPGAPRATGLARFPGPRGRRLAAGRLPRRRRAGSLLRKFGSEPDGRRRSGRARVARPRPRGSRGAAASAWRRWRPSRSQAAGCGTAHRTTRCTLPARDT